MRRDRGRDVRPDPTQAHRRSESTPDPTGAREPSRTAHSGALARASRAAGAVRIAAHLPRISALTAALPKIGSPQSSTFQDTISLAPESRFLAARPLLFPETPGSHRALDLSDHGPPTTLPWTPGACSSPRSTATSPPPGAWRCVPASCWRSRRRAGRTAGCCRWVSSTTSTIDSLRRASVAPPVL